MEPIDTSKYNLIRNPDNSIVRVDGLGNEAPEMTVDYYVSQIAFHRQVITNLEAQAEKLADFEAENPPVPLEEEEPAQELL